MDFWTFLDNKMKMDFAKKTGLSADSFERWYIIQEPDIWNIVPEKDSIYLLNREMYLIYELKPVLDSDFVKYTMTIIKDLRDEYRYYNHAI